MPDDGRVRQLIVHPDWLEAIAAWERWLRARGRSPGTIRLRTKHVLRAAVSLPTPWEVKFDDLVAVLDHVGWAPETRKSMRSSLRSFYSWAVESERIEVDPSARLGTVAVPAGKPKPTPTDILDRALAVADESGRLMLLLGAYAGLRRAEIAALHSDDIVDGSLRIVGKGGRTRLVPIHPKLAAALVGVSGYAFPGRFGGHLTDNNVGVRCRALLGGCHGAHTLRHAFATRAYATKRDILAVSQLLGHSKPETTMRYTQLPDDALRDAVFGIA